MPQPNRIDVTVTPAAIATIDAHLTDLRTKLPFLIDLSVDERRSLPKMGDKSRAFVQRTLELAQADDSFLPRKFDVSLFAKDLALWNALEPIRQKLATLLELVEDTQTLAGSEAYLAALDVYHSAKRSGKGSGLDELLDRVSQRFVSRRSDEDSPAP